MSVLDTAPAQPSPSRLTWSHPPEGFVRLSLLNGILRALTLGVYHFWGRTEVRQRIWSAVRIDGEPLEYRGTGGELFRGFLIVFAVVLVPLAAIGLAPLLLDPSPATQSLYQTSLFVLVIGLSGLGIFRARRYRLSRTRWRGIRGGLAGRSTPYAWTYFWSALLIPLTLGWIIPWRAATLQRALFNATYFGDKAFAFHGRSGPLYKRFWLVWVSAILLFLVAFTAISAVYLAPIIGQSPAPDAPPPLPTLGQAINMVAIALTALLIFAMIQAWYSSGVLNYFASETSYQGCRFRLRTTVGSLVWLAATNYLMRTLTLGMLTPVAEARTMRYLVERLSIEGHIDWPAIGQNPLALARGEGLAEAFNVDAF